ncbi:hypothetical protein DFH29DRAFT_875082 [Suillus ampliporus]|nr:hypothetical protein DFH29DRAFT_875082 [Suillus ampliporus]
MSDTLELNCWILGDGPSPQNVFTVEIQARKTVSILRDTIKKKKKKRFYCIDAEELELWQVNINSNDLHLLDTIRDEGSIKGGVRLNPTVRLCKVFEDGLEDERVHIIVGFSAVPRGGSVMEDPTDVVVRLNTASQHIPLEEFKNILQLGTTGPNPSTAAKSTQYRQIQGGPRLLAKIYDGRFAEHNLADTHVLPIQLFNPAFAYFSSKAFDPTYDVPDETLNYVQDLMHRFATIHSNEDARKLHLTSLLEKVIGAPFICTCTRDGKCIPDASVLASHQHTPICLIVNEEKNEIGDGGSDPAVQASFSFLRISSHQESELHLRCNCPAFLLVHAGPWLAVLGAVLTEKCVVQRLTDFIWIPAHSAIDRGQCLRVARVMHALRESVVQLKDWYDGVFKHQEPLYDLSRPVRHSRFFPTPDTYICDGNPVRFSYQEPLESYPSCVTYLAKTAGADPINVVVKFVCEYGEDVHKVMAEAGFAPKLLYYGPINITSHMPSYGTLRMVVMEYVDGTTAYSSSKLPENYHHDLTKAINYCHAQGFVFGDLRKPNVMITKDDKVQLIDFDWAGREGEVRYPISISRGIDWPEGVRGNGHILKKHDRDMLLHYRN